ncbi:MAG: ribonuclease HII [Patescibacteria group bacterium]|jgi:ribonuclease HII
MLDLQTEQEFFNLGYQYLGGLDEAGRGPLAGPVVAACVVIDSHFKIDQSDLKLVTDSKKLSASKREQLFKIIKEKVTAVEIGIATNEEIDQINILQASFLAMRRAVKKLKIQPDYLLVDGNFKVPQLNKSQTAIVHGDAQVFCIAAASIIAKVSRDWLITELAKKYPQYELEKHKGYGTKRHLELIAKYGPSPLHRLSFAPFRNKKA